MLGPLPRVLPPSVSPCLRGWSRSLDISTAIFRVQPPWPLRSHVAAAGDGRAPSPPQTRFGKFAFIRSFVVKIFSRKPLNRPKSNLVVVNRGSCRAGQCAAHCLASFPPRCLRVSLVGLVPWIYQLPYSAYKHHGRYAPTLLRPGMAALQVHPRRALVNSRSFAFTCSRELSFAV